MAEYTRGEFLGIGAALAGAFSLRKLPSVGQPPAAPPASLPPLNPISSSSTRVC